ncbi:MAG: PLP-dependent aminotransferase family protein [Caldimonas sp.]
MGTHHLGRDALDRLNPADPIFEVALKRLPSGSLRSGQLLYVQLCAAILDGRLAPGSKLPASRKAAGMLGVSRYTAMEVYERLIQGGFAFSRHGAGTYVGNTKTQVVKPRTEVADTPDRRLNPFWLRDDVSHALNFWQERADESRSPRGDKPIDFRPGIVDPRLFPMDIFRRVVAKSLRVLERTPTVVRSAQGNQGNRGLRNAITRHIALTRTVVCSAADVLITAGAQQAFDLIARSLITPDRRAVAMEDPGYPPMRAAFAAAGARLVYVPVDQDGLIVELLPQDVSVICVCPTHQFPLGGTMSQRRREALVAFAREHGAVIVEDDYDGEFRLGDTPVGALRTSESSDVVFHVGTFSKCMLPSLRLGFVIAPEWAMPTLVAAKNAQDWHCPSTMQMAVAAFIDEGHLSRHVRKMRDIYKRRRRLLVALIEGRLSEWVTCMPSAYGMHLAVIAHGSMDCDRFASSLAARGVHLHSLRRYSSSTMERDGWVLGFGMTDDEELVRGIALLRDALISASKRRPADTTAVQALTREPVVQRETIPSTTDS